MELDHMSNPCASLPDAQSLRSFHYIKHVISKLWFPGWKSLVTSFEKNVKRSSRIDLRYVNPLRISTWCTKSPLLGLHLDTKKTHTVVSNLTWTLVSWMKVLGDLIWKRMLGSGLELITGTLNPCSAWCQMVYLMNSGLKRLYQLKKKR